MSTQAAKAEQDKVMLDRVTRDNGARLQQRAVAAQQARLEEQRWEISLCCWLTCTFFFKLGHISHTAWNVWSLRLFLVHPCFGSQALPATSSHRLG